MNSCQDRARPWAIFQLLPSGFSECVARFKKRSDADAYMSILRYGGGTFRVTFDQQSTTQSLSKDCSGN